MLLISVAAFVSVDSNKLLLEVKYLSFKIYKLEKNFKSEEDNGFKVVEIEDDARVKNIRQESKNKAQSASTASENEASVTDEEPKDKKKSVKEIISEYKPYFPVAKKALKKLLKMIRFYDLSFDLTVGDTDAYEAAMKFGKVNSLVYSFLALLCCLFSVKIKATNINCSFEKGGIDASFSTVVKVRPLAVLGLAIYLGINYLKINHKKKKQIKKDLKIKEKNNEREES